MKEKSISKELHSLLRLIEHKLIDDHHLLNDNDITLSVTAFGVYSLNEKAVFKFKH